MDDVEAEQLAETAAIIAAARARLNSQGTFRLRVLLDMVILEVDRLRRRSAGTPRPDKPAEL